MTLDLGRKSFGLLVLGIAGMMPMSAINIVTNSGFETGDFTGWTQNGNTTFNGVFCPGVGPNGSFAGNCAAFFGPVGSTGGISQLLNTTIGTTYLIQFAFHPDGGTPTTSFSASFGASTLLSLTNPPGSAYQLFSFASTATTATTLLSFTFRDDPGFMFLDAVSVETAPEPGTVTLLGTGLGALIYTHRRKMRKGAKV